MSDTPKPPFWRAMAALAIDAVLIFGTAIGISLAIYGDGPMGGGAGVVLFVLFGIYYFIVHPLLGGTVGDRLMGIAKGKRK
jgi:hypothetical protein